MSTAASEPRYEAGRAVRRSRSALLWGAACFAAAQLAILALMLTRLPQWLDPGYGRKAARLGRRLAGPGPPVFVAVLGSSRVAWGVRGGPVERELRRRLGRPAVVFNLGLMGGGPPTELISLRRLLADGGRPDLVLVEALPLRLAGQVAQDELCEAALPTGRLRWGELAAVEHYSAGLRRGLRGEWWRARAVPCYHHRTEILSTLFPSLLHYTRRDDAFNGQDETGWVPCPHRQDSAACRAAALRLARDQTRLWASDFRLGGPCASALPEVLAECRRERIRAALLLMPEGPTFRSWYPPGAWEQVESFVGGLGRQFGVPVIRAREWVGEDGFADSHHLLPGAAHAFSERLGREAVAPLLADDLRARGGP
jgi:hypothetical protein